MTTTIKEDYTLPSKGLIYGKPFSPKVTLRSMTVAEEMKRLSPSDTPYKVMSEIIEDCLEEKLPIPVYDLCLGDYTYLLHKLRTVTYGSEYKLKYTCPKCGEIVTDVVDLDTIPVHEYDESINENMLIVLPTTNVTVKLKFQTPRDLDRIFEKAKELKKKFPDMQGDPSILLTLESLIEEIDGSPVNPITIGETLKSLPMKDVNILLQKATMLNGKVGVDTMVNTTCKSCGNSINLPFRYTSEFFGPEAN